VETQNYHLSLTQLFQIDLAFESPAGTSKRALRASLIFLRTIRNDFIGARNDIRASITNQGSLSMSVLVSNGTELEANVEK